MTGYEMDFTYQAIKRNTYQINFKIRQEGSLDCKATDVQLRYKYYSYISYPMFVIN